MAGGLFARVCIILDLSEFLWHTCNFTSDDAKLSPIVSIQDWQHGGHLMVNAGSQLQVACHFSPQMRSKPLKMEYKIRKLLKDYISWSKIMQVFLSAKSYFRKALSVRLD